MIRRFAAALALALALLFAAPGANAAAVVHLGVYLENNNHNPGTVTVSCGQSGPVLHTALFNDHPGNNVAETAVIYREPANPSSGLGVQVFGPVDIPLGGSVPVTLPYIPGAAWNAIAVAKGDPLPATLSDLIARLVASPPTADNSQLLPSGYPSKGPADCPTPTPTPTTSTTGPNCDNGDKSEVCPTGTPTPTPSKTQSATPSATTSGTPSATPSTTFGGQQLPVASPTTPTTPAPSVPSGPTLAHTGSSAVPLAVAALAALVSGGLLVWASRRSRSRS